GLSVAWLPVRQLRRGTDNWLAHGLGGRVAPCSRRARRLQLRYVSHQGSESGAPTGTRYALARAEEDACARVDPFGTTPAGTRGIQPKPGAYVGPQRWPLSFSSQTRRTRAATVTAAPSPSVKESRPSAPGEVSTTLWRVWEKC